MVLTKLTTQTFPQVAKGVLLDLTFIHYIIVLQFSTKNQVKLRHQSSTALKKSYKWVMDSNNS